MSRNSRPQDPLECWRIVASGRKRALPKGFWDGDEGLERIRVVGGYLVANGLDPLSLTDSKARALHIRGAVYRAGGLLELIDMVFPGKYFPWQMRKSGPCLWKEKRDVWGPRAVRWLVEERLGMPVGEAPKRLELAHFYENGLGGLAKLCSNRLFDLADLGYPGLFRPWQFKKSKEWWKDDDLCRKAVLWLLSIHGLDSPSLAHRMKSSTSTTPASGGSSRSASAARSRPPSGSCTATRSVDSARTGSTAMQEGRAPWMPTAGWAVFLLRYETGTIGRAQVGPFQKRERVWPQESAMPKASAVSGV